MMLLDTIEIIFKSPSLLFGIFSVIYCYLVVKEQAIHLFLPLVVC